jgi:hypothetical protein
MSNTVVGFTIQIDGVNSINQLNAEIKQTKEAMNALDLSTEQGNKEFQELSQTLGKLTATQKGLKKAQDDVNKSFLPEKSLGAYDQASAKLNKLRKEFKNAALDGSKSAAELDKLQKEIQKLDKTLKKVDGQVGQFQRNVGNYPKTFARLTRSLNQAIPGFEAFSSQLRDSEGRLSTFGKALIGGFLAFQAVNLIGRAIGQLDEFNKKITETRNTVQTFSNAYGEDLDRMTASTTALANTFDTDAKTISEAAQSLSQNLGISFEDALGRLEGTLVEGRGDVDTYLNKIKEMPEAFSEASAGTTEVEKANRRLLDSNKELAASQVAIAEEAAAVGNEFKVISNTVMTNVITVFVKLYNVFKPLFTAIYELGSAIFGLMGSFLSLFSGGNKAVSLIDIFTNALKLVIVPITFVINALTSWYNLLKFLSPVLNVVVAAIVGYRVAIIASTVATRAQAFAMGVYNGVMKLFTSFTKGATTAAKGFNAAIKANPIGLLIGAASAATAALSTMGSTVDDEQKKLEELAKKEKAAADAAQRRTNAYQNNLLAIEKTFQDSKKANDLALADGTKSEEDAAEESVRISKIRINALLQANKDQLADNMSKSLMGIAITEGENEAILQSNAQLQAELGQLDVEAAKIATKRRKDKEEKDAEAEQIRKDKLKKFNEIKENFLKQEEDAERKSLALLADLRAKYLDEQIKNIKDDQERQLKEIQVGAERQIEALDEQLKNFQDENKERDKEQLKAIEEVTILYGAKSKEVLELEKKRVEAQEEFAKDEKEIKTDIENVKVEITKQAEIQSAEVRAEFRQEELDKAMEQIEKLKDFRQFALDSEIDFITDGYELRNLKNEEALNKSLILEKDAKAREQLIRLAAEQEAIDKIAELRNQIQALNDAELELLDENKELKVDISQEERDKILLSRQKLFTELSEIEKKQTEDVEKNAEEQRKIKQDQFEQILGYFSEGLDLLSQFFDVANERQQAAFDADIERSQQRQEYLQAELDNSFGLRRRYFQQQLDAEIANQQKIEKAKEELEKKAAKQRKAIAIIESLINTALAISKANTLIPPANIPAMIAAGIIGAAQTALIAAQPLAEGGVVGKLGDEIVQFADGGRVTSKGNIKPLSNGDNVLATLKTGEVVLNQDQQRRIGYSTLKAARIPNFAMGGVVGAPSGFLQDSLNKVNEEQNRFKVMQDLVLETQGRIDRLQVVYTASTDDDVEKGRNERKEIRATASF